MAAELVVFVAHEKVLFPRQIKKPGPGKRCIKCLPGPGQSLTSEECTRAPQGSKSFRKDHGVHDVDDAIARLDVGGDYARIVNEYRFVNHADGHV